ncbi:MULTISPECIES: antiviral reverse transcriptase Drt3b [unclassified Pseudomonas]|uniref:antiviral reverse transcriptase Drt3b n=1 Tax=unclassified Pseudomonas TaxID=196821 RepID=UPI001CBBA3D1|nr:MULTISPECIES: antiviral reverse transcriptase Drt3b [unclassified Pseudomonas]
MYKPINNKVRIRKNDEYRALLTETLPYEVPMLFSNEGLYLAAKDKLIDKLKNVHGLDIFKSQPTIPYKYKIRKNSFESRGLAIMHPAQQLETGVFYSQYDHLIVGLCQRSPFSLRAPASIASYYVERARSSGNAASKDIQMETDGFEAIPNTGTSYFAYKKFPFLFRFYDSLEFLRLEKKFKQLTKMDISDCFNRIYTHTIAWAVKSKSHAKRNKTQSSFENSFDKLIQNANHGETAGIIIGPEVSRIFAEIILQRIDLEIVSRCTQLNLRLDVDYTIRRYVDDYFIYTNQVGVQDALKKLIPDALLEYKLAVNHAKTSDQVRPYITNTSISRHSISLNVAAFFNKYVEIKSEASEETGKSSTVIYLKEIDNVTAAVVQTIAAVKRSIGETGSYDATANYFLGMFKKFLSRMVGKKLKSEKAKPDNDLYFFLTAVIDIVFFYYSMTLRVRQTYQMSEIILMISKIMKSLPADLQDSLVRKIVDESRLIIQQANSDFPEHKIEVMNLLIVLRSLGDNYIFDSKLLSQIFDFELDVDNKVTLKDNFDYFQLVFLISYVGGVPALQNMVRAAVNFSTDRFALKNWADEAENVFLFFDLLSCPYASTSEKQNIAKLVLRHVSEKNLNDRANQLLGDVSNRTWFFGWNKTADLGMVLKKKELRTPY